MWTKILLLAAVCAISMGRLSHYGYDHGHVVYHHVQPYDYGYDVKDDYGNQQYKKETGDGKGGVKGSYGYTDAHGIHRQVNYVADHHGFRAHVKTNEPGTANQNPAAVGVHSAAPKYEPQYAPHHAPSYVVPYVYGPHYVYY